MGADAEAGITRSAPIILNVLLVKVIAPVAESDPPSLTSEEASILPPVPASVDAPPVPLPPVPLPPEPSPPLPEPPVPLPPEPLPPLPLPVPPDPWVPPVPPLDPPDEQASPLKSEQQKAT